MKLSTECLEASQVDSLLQGNLTPEEYEAAQEHLELCETCRARVEATIGPEQWWSEVQNVMRSKASLHVAASLRDAEGRRVKEVDPDAASLGETRLRENVLDLLGPTDDPNMLGRIGPYEIIALLGQGGMGAVFKGFDRSLNRFVAIKMLLPHLAASGAARKRFAREAQAVAAVVDDHVMAIHCVDEWQGVPYLVMTYSRGITLQKRLSDNGPLAVREILRVGMQAAKGLAAAHAQGIVHRDIKPANIFLDQTVERVQLMDFGLARAVDDASLTRTGVLAGTPQYMSPEQARAEAVDHRSDLFSLGSVMYAMCTGHAPFRAESSYSVLRLITDRAPRPIREINPDVPEWLCMIIAKLMAKQTCDRYESAEQVAKLIEDCLAHSQQPSFSPLPDSLIPKPKSRSSRRFFKVGAFTMVTLISSMVLGMLLMQPLNEQTQKSRAGEQEFKQLELAEQDLRTALSNALDNARNDEDRQRAEKQFDAREVCPPKYIALEEKYRGTPAGFEALNKVVNFARSVGDPTCVAAKSRIEAVDRLITHYANYDGVEKTFDAFNGGPSVPRHKELLQAVFEKNASRHVQAEALVAQLELNQNILRARAVLPELAETYSKYPAEWQVEFQATIKELESVDPDGLRAESNRIIEQLKNYGQLAVATYGTAHDAAQHLSHLINTVVVGKPAPEINAITSAGEQFQLSKMRGTTVLLVFALDHSDYDVMYAPLRKLAADYKDKHVEVVMILREHSKAISSAAALKRDLPWTVIRDSGNGPISLDWGVKGFPLAILIDSKGILRSSTGMPFWGDDSGYDTVEVAAALDELLRVAPKQ